MAKRVAPEQATDREELLAQERLLFMVQSTMQRMLNDQGLRYRDLARRMSVSEARISQLFGDEASNMTIKTIAKVFHHLNAKAMIMAADELEKKLAEARGQTEPRVTAQWIVSESLNELELGVTADVVPSDVIHKDVSGPTATPRDWADAEIAVQQRTRAA